MSRKILRCVGPDGEREITVTGRFPRHVRLRSEYFEFFAEPNDFIAALRKAGIRGDLLSFVDGVARTNRRPEMRTILESKAILRIGTYEDWWKTRINDKTRNMVRKAGKKGVDVRTASFDSKFIEGIWRIYNETPLRQGRTFHHYGMTLEQTGPAHAKFRERCDFIGAYLGDELIGFAKLVHMDGYSALMQIIAMVQHRDKAPTNALLAKAVEICAAKQVPILMYGMWSRRTLGDFKKHHGFERIDVPRYFVPLNLAGQLALKLGLHQPISEKLVDSIPEDWLRSLADLRTRWLFSRQRRQAT